MEKFPGWFEKGALSAVRESCNSLGLHHTSVTVLCEDSEGDMVHRTMAHVTSMSLFLHAVTRGHDVAPDIMISADGGGGKEIVTATVFYRGENGIEEAEMYLLAMIDDVPETRQGKVSSLYLFIFLSGLY